MGACSSFNKKIGVADDHFSEEVLEKYIEAKTGLDIDLTPDSKEKNKGHFPYFKDF